MASPDRSRSGSSGSSRIAPLVRASPLRHSQIEMNTADPTNENHNHAPTPEGRSSESAFQSWMEEEQATPRITMMSHYVARLSSTYGVLRSCSSSETSRPQQPWSLSPPPSSSLYPPASQRRTSNGVRQRLSLSALGRITVTEATRLRSARSSITISRSVTGFACGRSTRTPPPSNRRLGALSNRHSSFKAANPTTLHICGRDLSRHPLHPERSRLRMSTMGSTSVSWLLHRR